MHPSAYETARRFFEQHWRPEFQSVVEIGSMNVNGSLRELCPAVRQYMGLDLAPGDGVDLVMPLGQQLPFEDGWFDVALSSSQLEHDPCFWATFSEMARITRSGGLIYINAPSVYRVHRHPMDYWRFNLDAAMALEQWALREGYPVDLIEAGISEPDGQGQTDFSAIYARI